MTKKQFLGWPGAAERQVSPGAGVLRAGGTEGCPQHFMLQRPCRAVSTRHREWALSDLAGTVFMGCRGGEGRSWKDLGGGKEAGLEGSPHFHSSAAKRKGEK